MPSILSEIHHPSDDIRQQFTSVKAFLEDELLGEGSLFVAESQLVWSVGPSGTDRQGIAIDYPNLTMHGIVTHDPKYPEEHLVVIVQKSNDDEENDSATAENDEQERERSPVEYDAIQTINYRFVMATSDDLKIAYQTIADCQALHPDPTDDVLEDDEVGSDIDYGEEEEEENNTNGNDDPYGYSAHFASSHRTNRGSRYGHGDQDDQDDDQNNGDQHESME